MERKFGQRSCAWYVKKGINFCTAHCKCLCYPFHSLLTNSLFVTHFTALQGPKCFPRPVVCKDELSCVRRLVGSSNPCDRGLVAKRSRSASEFIARKATATLHPTDLHSCPPLPFPPPQTFSRAWPVRIHGGSFFFFAKFTGRLSTASGRRKIVERKVTMLIFFPLVTPHDHHKHYRCL